MEETIKLEEHNRIVDELKKDNSDLQTELKVLKLKLADKDSEINGYRSALDEVTSVNTRYKIEVKHGIKKVAATSDIDEKLLRLIADGKHYKEIAEELGVTYTTVYRHCHKLRDLGLIDTQRRY